MPICVECGAPVTNLYTEYSKGNIHLTHCEKCKKFADKYIEHDFVIIFIDMLLHKPQVYRHLLFNRLEYRDYGVAKCIEAWNIVNTF
ncbi:10451_t:CDS:2 [Diversispora eburnea]|uniref:Protein ARV n=1 Tax=Diversispora eburnea TaxID=1213867 RepID=A0A9N9B6X7_9GLOM|nr:10451_t:CDS:2 [Diversispora eburnea]